jgi:hypothetical protein
VAIRPDGLGVINWFGALRAGLPRPLSGPRNDILFLDIPQHRAMTTARLCLSLVLIVLSLGACRSDDTPEPADEAPAAADTVPTFPADPTAPDLPPVPEDTTTAATVRVDLTAGTIGGVDFDEPVDVLVRRLGDEAVREEQTEVEGEPRTVYTFTVEGGEVRRNGALVQYRDARFRTADGLGVGATVAEFGARFGHTEITRGEEAQCQGASFRAAGRHVRACVPRGCTTGTCRVVSVEFVSEAGVVQ